MEQPKLNVTHQDIMKLRSEMAMFRGMLNHLKSVVFDLKQVINTELKEEKTRDSTPISTDSGMSSETPPNQKVAQNGVDSNRTPATDINQDDAAMLLLNLKNGSSRPVQPLRYGIIRHNPNRTLRSRIKDESNEEIPATPEMSQSLPAIEADVKEINDTPETYLHKKKKAIKNIAVVKPSRSEANGNMIPIGSGKTLVPKDAYAKIKWNSYSIATRKLLVAVFPRKVLATHSLTGKASPAFTDKPAKVCLDPRKVADIVITVTSKCKVKESLVRNAITTKCADENKMLRMKLRKKTI